MALFPLNVFDDKIRNLESRIDDIIQNTPPRITPLSSTTSEGISSDIINHFVTQTTEEKAPGQGRDPFGEGEVSSLLEQVAVPTDRQNRYKVYDEIYRSVPMIKRMIKVYISNVLNKNPVNNRSLLTKEKSDIDFDVKNSQDFEQNKEVAKSFIETTESYFEIVNKLKNKIIPMQTLYGDCFVEVVGVEEWTGQNNKQGEDTQFLGESSLSSSYKKPPPDITSTAKRIETRIDEMIKTNSINSYNIDARIDPIINDLAECFVAECTDLIDLEFENTPKEAIRELSLPVTDDEIDHLKMIYEYEATDGGVIEGKLNKYMKDKDSTKPNEKWSSKIPNKIDLGNILMLIHSPHNIVIMETEYGTRLGYVEIRKSDQDTYLTNVGQQLGTIIGKLTTFGVKSVMPQDAIINRLIKAILKKIMKDVAPKESPANYEKILKTISPEVYNFIKKILIETEKSDKSHQYKRLRARFIPVKRVFHFNIPGADYAPYGVSIVDPLILHSKLYILSQMSNVITKLSRAAVIRRWVIDVGPTQISNLVLYNRNIIRVSS